MSRFIQLHLLTAYPPANLNRDDQGSPKIANMGGYDRLRVSSQCLKRTWRTSEIFENAIDRGVRTKMIGRDAFDKLSEFPLLAKTEKEMIAKNIAKVFGSLRGDSLELDTLAFISSAELANIDKVILNFKNGLGSATVESNNFGVHLFKTFVSDIQTSITDLIGILKGENPIVRLKTGWDKPKGIREIIKKYKYKTSEDKSPYDYLVKMIDRSDEWIDEIFGDQEVRDDELELFFAADLVKLVKEILKKLSLGGLLTAKAAKEIEYGVIKHKNHIKLCEGWEEQIKSWVNKVRSSEDDDYLSDDNIQNLKLVVAPGAIPKSAILTNEHTNADIALFGRMLASSIENNIEAACQVAHAISVHPVVIEDDYFTAVEEMNEYREDAGAAHIGETRFAAGLFYSYVCINRELLIDNLDGDVTLANKAIRALAEAAVKVAPQGKQNSFASRAYASYVLAEKGEQQPRSLSVAFLKPINNRENDDYVRDSIAALKKQCESFDNVYGACADTSYEMNVADEKGNLVGLLNFVSE